MAWNASCCSLPKEKVAALVGVTLITPRTRGPEMDTMSRSLKTERTVDRLMSASLTLTSWCQPLLPNPKTPHTKPGIAATTLPPTLWHSKEYEKQGNCLLPRALTLRSVSFSRSCWPEAQSHPDWMVASRPLFGALENRSSGEFPVRLSIARRYANDRMPRVQITVWKSEA
jgi:hypothetical protein